MCADAKSKLSCGYAVHVLYMTCRWRHLGRWPVWEEGRCSTRASPLLFLHWNARWTSGVVRTVSATTPHRGRHRKAPSHPTPRRLSFFGVSAASSRSSFASGEISAAAQSVLTKPSQPPIAEAGDGAIDLKPLVAFLAECVPHADRDRADWADIYASFLEWQQRRGGEALTAALLGVALKHVCELADIRIRRQGDRVYCLDRRIAWKN